MGQLNLRRSSGCYDTETSQLTLLPINCQSKGCCFRMAMMNTPQACRSVMRAVCQLPTLSKRHFQSDLSHFHQCLLLAMFTGVQPIVVRTRRMAPSYNYSKRFYHEKQQEKTSLQSLFHFLAFRNRRYSLFGRRVLDDFTNVRSIDVAKISRFIRESNQFRLIAMKMITFSMASHRYRVSILDPMAAASSKLSLKRLIVDPLQIHDYCEWIHYA